MPPTVSQAAENMPYFISIDLLLELLFATEAMPRFKHLLTTPVSTSKLLRNFQNGAVVLNNFFIGSLLISKSAHIHSSRHF
jgi:hypothetical protein